LGVAAGRGSTLTASSSGGSDASSRNAASARGAAADCSSRPLPSVHLRWSSHPHWPRYLQQRLRQLQRWHHCWRHCYCSQEPSARRRPIARGQEDVLSDSCTWLFLPRWLDGLADQRSAASLGVRLI
jgi:hypothetical protein